MGLLLRGPRNGELRASVLKRGCDDDPRRRRRTHPERTRYWKRIARGAERAGHLPIRLDRDSPQFVGGDALSGYAVGNLFRARKMRTAVSGFCYSSCSRMFLGGVVRQFTSDYPQEFTEVGFHGHYRSNGRLDAAYVARLGLAAWIHEHSDGKADPALVERWINIPFSSGLIQFYHRGLQQTRGHTTFMCQGDDGLPIFRCEAVARTALDVGVITSLNLLPSNDQRDLRASVPARIEPSGWASDEDLVRVPLVTDAGRAEYQRFLAAPDPKAFAVSSTGVFWAWNSGPSNALARALERCAARSSGQPCALYAIDNPVVWAPHPAPGTSDAVIWDNHGTTRNRQEGGYLIGG